jgi:hypothetical protein
MWGEGGLTAFSGVVDQGLGRWKVVTARVLSGAAASG